MAYTLQPKRILVRVPNWLGDAVMSIPALQAVRARYPDAHIAILARPWVADLYLREPFADEVIVLPGDRLPARLRFATSLRDRGFDMAILFQNAFEAALLAFAAGIPVRIGYARDARSWLLTHPIAVPGKGDIPAHERFYYLELLRRAAIIPELPVQAPVRLTREPSETRWIGVSPGAAYGTAKRWLPERFAQAAAELAQEVGLAVAVFGAPGERDVCEQVAEGVRRLGATVHNFAGRTSVAEFVKLVTQCRLFLTNDSGAMHVASALGVPTVAIFGATNPEATGPAGTCACVVYDPPDCAPCLLRHCPIDHRCMTAVTAPRVVAAARALLSEQPPTA